MNFRRYVPEETIGAPAPVSTMKQRRALIGKRIEWNTGGFVMKRSGTVTAVEGKNMLIDGDWKWAPDMLNVRVSE
jgi:hypothetical protein